MFKVTLKQGYNDVVLEFEKKKEAVDFAMTCLGSSGVVVKLEKVVEEDAEVQNAEG